MNFVLATRRPRTRPFREEMALDVLLFGDCRQVRLISLRHLAVAAGTTRRIRARRELAAALGGHAVAHAVAMEA